MEEKDWTEDNLSQRNWTKFNGSWYLGSKKNEIGQNSNCKGVRIIKYGWVEIGSFKEDGETDKGLRIYIQSDCFNINEV